MQPNELQKNDLYQSPPFSPNGFINWPLLNKNRLKQMPGIQGRSTLFGDYAVAVFRLAHNGQERTFCQFYSAPYYSERVHYIAYYSRFFESSYGF